MGGFLAETGFLNTAAMVYLIFHVTFKWPSHDSDGCRWLYVIPPYPRILWSSGCDAKALTESFNQSALAIDAQQYLKTSE